MNSAYKHLDTKLRIAELSIQQWIGVLVGVSFGIAWALYLSPFGTSVTLVTAIYLGAVPAGAAVLASSTEFDLWVLIRSAVAWWRHDGRFLPGPGVESQGYAVQEDTKELELRQRRLEALDLDLESLWKES